jgi:hypothetical protein
MLTSKDAYEGLLEKNAQDTKTELDNTLPHEPSSKLPEVMHPSQQRHL